MFLGTSEATSGMTDLVLGSPVQEGHGPSEMGAGK